MAHHPRRKRKYRIAMRARLHTISFMKNDFGAMEVKGKIAEIVGGPTRPKTKARMAALASVKWFLATEDGQAVGIRGVASKLVPLEEAQVFDGRDNEDAKRRFFEALLKVRLHVISIEKENA
jgi:hypothetical protein